jgi:ABC-2 type transport system permease protein
MHSPQLRSAITVGDVWAMVVKEFRELRRDPRTMAMLIALPLLFLVILGYAANFTITSVRTQLFGPQAAAVGAQLTAPFDVTKTDPNGTQADAHQALVDNRADVAIVTASSGPPTALVNGSQLFAAQAAVSALNRSGLAATTQVLFNPMLKTSWVMVPGLIGLILAFIGTIVTCLGLVRERTAGTLEQLAVMPFRPSDVIVGKIAPYFLLAAIDLVLVTVLGMLLFGVPFRGSPFLFAVGGAIFLFVVLGLGVFISTISHTEGQAIQTAILVLLPLILMSGMIFPLSSTPWTIRWIGYALPLTYFIEIAQGVMLRGESVKGLWVPFGVLTAMAIVVFGAAVLRFRRDLAPRVKPTHDAAPAA